MPFDQKHPAFITITCLEWKHFLKHDACKRIIIDALVYRVMNQQVKVFGFVIMPNHMHLIWKVCDELEEQDFQRDLLKYTAKAMLTYLKAEDEFLYHETEVAAKDRKHQIWERNSLSKEIFTAQFFKQKLEYIHNNPVQEKWSLAPLPEDYYWSSASFYYNNDKRWRFLTDYRD